MGNQAALSGLLRVPRGRLFGAELAVTVCKGIFDGWVYGSIRHIEDFIEIGTVAADDMLSRAFIFLIGGE